MPPAAGWPSLVRPLSPVLAEMPGMVLERYNACQVCCWTASMDLLMIWLLWWHAEVPGMVLEWYNACQVGAVAVASLGVLLMCGRQINMAACQAVCGCMLEQCYAWQPGLGAPGAAGKLTYKTAPCRPWPFPVSQSPARWAFSASCVSERSQIAPTCPTDRGLLRRVPRDQARLGQRGQLALPVAL